MDGLLLADKQQGASSHDVVAAVRRVLAGERTGHAGTLDPFATGLLLVLVGRATRVARFLTALPKTYRVTCRLGATSSTGDPEGEIVETGRFPDPDRPLPTGPIQQRPPAHSAVHVDGERAYRRARRGESFELPLRTVTVHRFEQIRRADDVAEYEIECSAGTYVRSLVSGLGDAYCQELRRTAIGPFSVDGAVPMPPVRGDLELTPLGEALGFMPRLTLTGEAARRATHGAAVLAPAGEAPPAGPLLLCDDRGEAIAVADSRAGRGGPELRPIVGLRG